jgi:hypothetical protein
MARGLRSLLPATLLAVAGLLAPAARAEQEFSDCQKAVEDALKSKDPQVRARAFEPLEGCTDPRAIDLVVRSVRDLVAAREKLRADQAAAEKAYEKAVTDLTELQRKFRELDDGSAKAMDAFNKRERKYSKDKDAALLKVRQLENEFSRNRALIDAGVQAVTTVLGHLEPAQLGPALDALEASWLRSKTPGDGVRWVDAIAGLDRPGVPERLLAAVGGASVEDGVKAAALGALAATKHPGVVAAALPNLALPADRFPLVAASIRSLARVHDRRGIEPLIAFLAREDVGRLREDARAALVSLTGQHHGPFKAPWAQWWDGAKADFKMPEQPQGSGTDAQDGPGVTFYGIHTFSNRILFVLDVSGSMDQAAKPGPQGGEPKPRIEIAKKELLGAIFNLDAGARFNLIFFNHEVVPWQPKMVEASEATKNLAKGWVEPRPPTGGTNLHDALEAGFAIATRTTGSPEIDTIFFLTDGRPTAGKIQDPKLILEQVREWNRTANLKIHVVGVGPPEDIDEPFLQELARIGEGQYVNRR